MSALTPSLAVSLSTWELHLPNTAAPILHTYPGGDVDAIKFPFEKGEPWAHRLAVALFDAIETGDLNAPERTVILPDGKRFNIDANIDPAESKREREARANW